MTKPHYPRTSCCVPFCRRTSTRFPNEWLCRDHWALVDRALKLMRTRLWRRLKAKPQRALAAERGIWRRMKRQAIERAAGAAA